MYQAELASCAHSALATSTAVVAALVPFASEVAEPTAAPVAVAECAVAAALAVLPAQGAGEVAAIAVFLELVAAAASREEAPLLSATMIVPPGARLETAHCCLACRVRQAAVEALRMMLKHADD